MIKMTTLKKNYNVDRSREGLHTLHHHLEFKKIKIKDEREKKKDVYD